MNKADLPGIESFEKWAYKKAYKYSWTADPYFEDIVQELMVGVWKGIESFKPGSVKKKDENYSVHDEYVGWVTRRAEWHLQKLWRDERWSGMPARYGKRREEYTVSKQVPLSSAPGVSRNDEDDHAEDHLIGYLLDMKESSSERAIDQVDVRYHSGEILGAIENLPKRQRDYVLGVFYQDKKITHILGNHREPADAAHETLAETLSHLRSIIVDSE